MKPITIAIVALLLALVLSAPVVAASGPEICEHVATAATIEIYYCDDINLFVNQLGFMVFEP